MTDLPLEKVFPPFLDRYAFVALRRFTLSRTFFIALALRGP